MERTETMTAASAPHSSHEGSYFDWPAIFGGAAVAGAIAVLFTGFGATLGLTAISPVEGEGSVGWSMIIVGAFVLISTLLAYAAGGYVAGRMRRRIDAASADEVAARDSMHGAVVWALGFLLSVWMAAGAIGTATSAIGNVASGAANVAGDVAGAATNAAGAVAQGVGAAGEAVASSDVADTDMLDSINPIEIINQRLLRGSGIQIDQNLQLPDGGKAILAEIARTGEVNEDDKAYLVQTIATNSNLTRAEAETRVDNATQEVIALRDQAAAKVEDLRQQAETLAEETKAKAIEAAEAARKASILTGFLLTAGFLIAAAAAIWGASLGGRHRDEGRMFGGFRSF